MSYNPTNWSDKTTPVDQSNLNKIEDGITQNANDISELNSIITDLNDALSTYLSSFDSFTAFGSGLASYTQRAVVLSASLVTEITGSSLSYGAGFLVKSGTSGLFDFFFICNRGARWFSGRISDGGITTLYSYSPTSALNIN